MRGLLASFALVALLSALPLASAQTPEDWLVLTVAPFTEPVRPLEGHVATEFTVDASCALFATHGGPTLALAYAIEEAPAWLGATVSPASDAASLQECDGGRVVRTGTLTVAASQLAPAFTAMPVVLRVTASQATGAPATATAEVPVAAAYFSVLDVQASQTQAVVASDAWAEFPLTFTNFGNGNTKITFEVTEAAEGLSVNLPSPVTLQSTQAGGSGITATVVVSAMPEAMREGVGQLTVRFAGAYALDPALAGDEGHVSFLVHRAGLFGARGSDNAERVPAPPPALVVPVLALAALGRRLRSARAQG